MNLQLTLALRYLSGRKLRTTLTTLAIVFGVLVVFGMNILIPSLTGAFQASFMAAAGQVDATLTLKTSDAFPASVRDRVAAMDGVRAATASLSRLVNLPVDYLDHDPALPDAITAVSLVGIDPDQARTVRMYPVTQGRFLQADDRAAAVISKSLAETFKVTLGDTFELPSPEGEQTLEVIGILPARALPGNEEVLVTLAQAQEMLNMPGMINAIDLNYDSVDETRRQTIEQSILAALGDIYQVGSLEANAEILTNMQLAQQIFSMLGTLALLMGGFIIFNTFRTIIVERRRDIGMLRALGANRKTIFGVILAEGLMQGVAGTLLGMLLGYGLGILSLNALNPILQMYMNVKIGAPAVNLSMVVVSLVIGVGITLLAGLLPAINATRITPLEALRPSVGAVTLKRMAGFGFWSGAALIVAALATLLTRNAALIGAGLVAFIIGLVLTAPALVNPIAALFSRLLALIFARDGSAQLAEGNLSRQPSRAAITASTTLIAMAIIVMAAGMITSVSLGFTSLVRKSLGSDYLFIPPSVALWGGNVGADPRLAEELRQVEGVEVVSALRFAPSQVNGVDISVMGIDPQAYTQVSGLHFSKGDESQAYAALEAGRNAIINGILASSAGIKLGDDLELITPGGKRAYRVVGIASDFLNAKIATAYIAHANIAEDFGRNEDVFIQLNLAPSADSAQVEKQLKALAAAYPQFRLINGKEYVEESLQLFDMAFAVIIALGVFLAVPSLIAMVNTLAIGVIERTREIGMLRAVGATRRQVRKVILAEALILSALGTSFGVAMGLYLAFLVVEAMKSFGFPMEYVFPAGGILAAVAAGILFGVLASIIPARQAARLEVVQALRYE